MNKDDLKQLGIEDDEIVNKIIVLHGKTIEKHKNDISALTEQTNTLKTHLKDANSAIEGFKKLDVEGIQSAADEWKQKAEQAATDADAKIQSLKFSYALDTALTSAKAKNVKAVKALLNTDDLKLNEEGELIGLDTQLEKLQAENDFLFEGEQDSPKIVAGTQHKSVLGDEVLIAARKAAGLSDTS